MSSYATPTPGKVAAIAAPTIAKGLLASLAVLGACLTANASALDQLDLAALTKQVSYNTVALSTDKLVKEDLPDTIKLVQSEDGNTLQFDVSGNTFTTWSKYSIPAGKTHFWNNAAQAGVVPYVIAHVPGYANKSQIDGTLKVQNLTFVLVNAAGVAFGNNGQITKLGSASTIVASNIAADLKKDLLPKLESGEAVSVVNSAQGSKRFVPNAKATIEVTDHNYEVAFDLTAARTATKPDGTGANWDYTFVRAPRADSEDNAVQFRRVFLTHDSDGNLSVTGQEEWLDNGSVIAFADDAGKKPPVKPVVPVEATPPVTEPVVQEQPVQPEPKPVQTVTSILQPEEPAVAPAPPAPLPEPSPDAQVEPPAKVVPAKPKKPVAQQVVVQRKVAAKIEAEQTVIFEQKSTKTSVTAGVNGLALSEKSSFADLVAQVNGVEDATVFNFGTDGSVSIGESAEQPQQKAKPTATAKKVVKKKRVVKKTARKQQPKSQPKEQAKTVQQTPAADIAQSLAQEKPLSATEQAYQNSISEGFQKAEKLSAQEEAAVATSVAASFTALTNVVKTSDAGNSVRAAQVPSVVSDLRARALKLKKQKSAPAIRPNDAQTDTPPAPAPAQEVKTSALVPDFKSYKVAVFFQGLVKAA